MATTYTNLESAINTVVGNFYKYAKQKGKEDKMNKTDFREMVKKEFQRLLTFTEDEEAVENLIQTCDTDKDGKISFDEYWKLIGQIAMKISHQKAMQ